MTYSKQKVTILGQVRICKGGFWCEDCNKFMMHDDSAVEKLFVSLEAAAHILLRHRLHLVTEIEVS